MIAIKGEDTKKLSRVEWLDARRNSIGGSDVAGILGMTDYSSPLKVYLDKKGLGNDDEDSEAAFHGRELEAYVARLFTLKTGKKVRRCNYILIHPEYPFMTADIDRFVIGEDTFLECKTANEYLKDEWEGDKVPDAYIAQCTHYMAVTGMKKGYVAVLIGGNKFHQVKIERDESLIKELIRREKDFWYNYVLKNIPPEPNGSKCDNKILFDNNPPSETEEKTIKIPEEMTALYIEKKDIDKEMEKLETRKNQINQLFKEAVGNNYYGKNSTIKITWKPSHKTEVDMGALQKEIDLTPYKVTKSTKYFRVSEVK